LTVVATAPWWSRGTPDQRRNLVRLTTAAGGRWDVSHDALRRRKVAENWEKPTPAALAARKARRAAADQLSAADRERGEDFDPLGTEAENSDAVQLSAATPAPAATAAEDAQVAVRAELRDLHRREWKGLRRVG